MYSPTALGAHGQNNEIIHQSDATAQQSQQAPTLLVNSTRAAERWDGKSKLLKFLEPIIDGVKSVLDPIANVFYGAMPATFRGLNSDAPKTNSVENVDDDLDELEIVKKPRQILVPQPRNIAQRKMTHRKNRNRPKKYTDLKVSLDRLKQNKDLYDYVKTKKYKYNYPNTYFYPRVKYFVNPNTFYKPNNSRLMPYKKEASEVVTATVLKDSDWKPIVVLNNTIVLPENVTNTPHRRRFRRKYTKKRRIRSKRSLDISSDYRNASAKSYYSESYNTGRGFFDFLELFFATDPIGHLIQQSNEYAKSVLKQSLKSKEPGYYTAAYNMVMMTLDVFEGLLNVNEALENHIFEDNLKMRRRKRRKYKKKVDKANVVSNCTRTVESTTENVTEKTNDLSSPLTTEEIKPVV